MKTWLNATSSRPIKDQCTACRTADTCQWIVDRPEYRAWLSPESKARTWWLHAPPGFGKSVTSAALAERLEREFPGAVVSYFCSATQEELRIPTNILRSCLTQSVLQRPDLLRLANKSKDQSDSQIATETELWQLFSILARTGNGLIILVDGFDECFAYESEVQRKCGFSRASFLRQLNSSVMDTPSRLVIVSRDENDIRSALNRSEDSIVEHEVVEYGIKREDVQVDIERFSAQQVEASLSKKPVELRKELTQHLTEKSDGMFLWVRLQTMQLKATTNVARLRKQMSDMPPDLNHIYERDWQHIQSTESAERDHTLLILRWVTFAVRPLTALELFEATAIQTAGSVSELSEDWLPDQSVTGDVIRQELLTPCRPFLILRQDDAASSDAMGVIQLAHFSMKIFLLKKFVEKACCTSSQLHDKTLTASCVGYLSNGLPWTKLEVMDTGLRAHPVLSYAVQNWMIHLDRSHDDFQGVRLLIRNFFHHRSPHWSKWRDAFETALDREDPAYIAQDIAFPPVEPGNRCYYASLFGLLDVLRDCLRVTSDEIKLLGGRHGTALQAACVGGHQSVVQCLLDSGADINARAGLRGCTLNAAAASGHEGLVALLLENGADFTTTDDFGRNALYTAARDGKDAVVKRLIDAGSPLDQRNDGSWTPLAIASSDGHEAVALALVEAGADVKAVCDEGNTPVHYAAMEDHGRILESLIAAGADPNTTNSEGWTPLNSAADGGYHTVVELLLRAGADPDTANSNGWTPVKSAAQNGHETVVELLLDAGADPNAANNDGWAPINSAANLGQLAIVNLLLKAKADLHVTNSGGFTPINSAAAAGHVAVVELLLKVGADLSVVNKRGWTPIHSAAGAGHLAVVELLLEAGADFCVTNTRGSTPLYSAAGNGHLSVVKVLQEYGAKPDPCCEESCTPLQIACRNGHKNVVEFYLESEMDILTHNGGYWQLLNLASCSGNCDLVEFLLAKGAEVNGVDGESLAVSCLCRSLLIHSRQDHVLRHRFIVSYNTAISIFFVASYAMVPTFTPKGTTARFHSILHMIFQKLRSFYSKPGRVRLPKTTMALRH